MVSMEFLLSKWCILEDLSKEGRKKYETKVKHAVHLLHESSYVHGDLGACNNFVWEGQVRIFDFDEAGPPGETVYPPFWNAASVTRPTDAREGEPLKFEQDNLMVEEIFEKGVMHKSGIGNQ